MVFSQLSLRTPALITATAESKESAKPVRVDPWPSRSGPGRPREASGGGCVAVGVQSKGSGSPEIPGVLAVECGFTVQLRGASDSVDHAVHGYCPPLGRIGAAVSRNPGHQRRSRSWARPESWWAARGGSSKKSGTALGRRSWDRANPPSRNEGGRREGLGMSR